MSDTKENALKTNAPLSATRIKQICSDACKTALGESTTYTHSMTETWNTNIINGILRSMISESTPTNSPVTSCPYKYAVNSTIIQHAPGTRTVADGEEISAPSGGRRGMHSACGGFWNAEKDGMTAYKHHFKDMDIVISIIWVGI